MQMIVRSLALVVTFCFFAHLTEGASTRGRKGNTRHERWYDFPCPRLECPSVTGCGIVEVVMWVHGARLCEGCPYCLDMPPLGLQRDVRAQSIGGGRFRRSAKLSIDTLPIAQNEVCNFASCPLKRPTVRCSRPSILVGYLHGDKCISCAFCSDDGMIEDQDGGLQVEVNHFDQH